MPRTSAHAACQDFHRASEASRRDVLTRRQLLRWGIGAGVSLYGAQMLPTERVLEAAAAQAAAAPDAPLLVSVFLPGGVDLLDTLVPVQQEGVLRDLRGGLAPVAGSLPLQGEGYNLHPSLGQGPGGGLQGLFNRGQIGFLPGIDYANPNLSHFASRAFWETGMVSQQSVSGWLGRWLDRHGSADNALQGLSAGYGLSPTLRAANAPVASVADAGDVQLALWSVWGDWGEAAVKTYAALAQSTPHAAGPAAAARAARLAHTVSDRLAPLRKAKDGTDPLAGPVTYPEGNDTADRLQVLAGLLSQPLGIRVATVDAEDSFDTHEGQAAALDRDLGAVGEALATFQADLESRGIADRVLTFVWSEFGRRPMANRSGGTDHGAGGIAWVQGPRAMSGILTDYPSLTDLDAEKNLKVTVDFRRVYSSLLGQWMH